METNTTIYALPISLISFPEVRLEQRAASQLRGFFGNYFREHSPLLHNHYDDGRLRYKYPLVQYKVLGGTPVLVGLQEGAKLLTSLFCSIQTLHIGEREYTVLERDISYKVAPVGWTAELNDYQFASLWLPLNQQMYPDYQQKDGPERRSMLARILTGNILSFYKGIGLFLPASKRINVAMRPRKEHLTGFKNQVMTGISGGFTANVMLPDFIGLGKSVSRGYGAIVKQ
jgi:hypothetical protein